jgi:hypothetical protein
MQKFAVNSLLFGASHLEKSLDFRREHCFLKHAVLQPKDMPKTKTKYLIMPPFNPLLWFLIPGISNICLSGDQL